MTNCNACHKPDKTKAELDMTSYAALMKGGKHGKTVVPGKPDDSRLIEEITGDEPTMPKEGDPLKAQQVAAITRWITEGAKDDTPAPGTTKVEAPEYTVAPAVTAMAFSPDGSLLAVAGYHEVLLHKADGSGLVARLVGESSRIESIAFSKDGKYLAAAGGSPGELGQVQIWDVATHKNYRTFQPSIDSLYGVSFSPDGKSIACGAADRIVRRIDIEDGKVAMEFKAHSDWVLATCFTLDGKQIVSGGRDRAMKLIDVASGRFVDDINNPLELVLCMARHPSQDKVIYGGDMGTARLYKISDNQGRTAGRIDTNVLVTFDRQRGPVNALAFSPDGNRVALASTGEVRIYDANNAGASKPMGQPASPPPPTAAQLTLTGHRGPVFAVSWKSDGTSIATAGADGKVRLFDAKSGSLIKEFIPVPIAAPAPEPTISVGEHQRRGEDFFRQSHFKESVAEFDKVIEMEPSREPYHWQRGISLYYAGEFERGAKQFELHKTVNPEDVENAVWHYLCVARMVGVEKARGGLIPIRADGRIPMMQVYALFGGKATVDDVLNAAKSGEPAAGELKLRMFYAHLYLGLFDEAAGRAQGAREHILAAAERFADEGYMGDVARVHARLIKEKPAGK